MFILGFSEARRKLEEMFADGERDEQLVTSFRFDFTATNMVVTLSAILAICLFCKDSLTWRPSEIPRSTTYRG